jgi:hypothetical protein
MAGCRRRGVEWAKEGRGEIRFWVGPTCQLVMEDGEGRGA